MFHFQWWTLQRNLFFLCESDLVSSSRGRECVSCYFFCRGHPSEQTCYLTDLAIPGVLSFSLSLSLSLSRPLARGLPGSASSITTGKERLSDQ